MITTLLELSTTKYWMMHPPMLNALRIGIQENIAGRIVLTAEQTVKRMAYAIGMTANGENLQFSMSSNDDEGNGREPSEKEADKFVAVLPVCGPITRNGDACSYGSIDFRDMMIQTSNHEECKGIIVYINSGGGSANAIPDYKYAIDYAHKKGKKVVALVDGDCYSAAMYLAVLCDEIYYVNVKDGFGSIGVYGGFYTMKSGEKNAYTNETWNEVYATQSYNKNEWYRKATDGDYSLVQEDLDNLCEEFMSDVKAARPNVTDDHLHGATFDAKDVKGILNDGQSTIAELVNRFLSEADTAPKADATATNTNTNINMEKYPLICNACGLQAGEIAVTEEGAYMNASLLDNLEAHMKEAEQKVTDAEQKVAIAETALAELQGKFDELSAQVNAANEAKAVAETALAEAKEAHSKELSDLNAQHVEAIAKKDDELKTLTEAKDKEIADLTAAKTETEANLQSAKDALATAEQSLADKQAQIDDLTNDAGTEQNAGNAPENNGEGVKVKTLRSFDGSKYKTNAERKAAFQRFLHGEEEK
ncbi:S49 family peptidase [uncultured Prevotella sp.]|uniref:S49 family peptidase n=1 Tax=uncultured Prevotella sp. TaxID=159272 RepID=UPI0027E2F6A3|nr:S49 family peptidase [uncultured Prevotella sp.]